MWLLPRSRWSHQRTSVIAEEEFAAKRAGILAGI